MRSRAGGASPSVGRLDGGGGENGVHKRSNGENGDETEKTRVSTFSFNPGATARSAVWWASVAAGTNRWDCRLLVPTATLAHRAGLRPASRPRDAASHPAVSVSPSLTPLLRL